MLFIQTLLRDPVHFVMTTLAVVLSVCIHEYCHARTALFFGDSTAAEAGHLTLNPLKQMGWISVIMLLFTGLAWGAVPVNPYRLSRKGRILTALAGPGANLCLFLASWTGTFLLLKAGAGSLFLEMTAAFIVILGRSNALLFLLNILPVPGFDGWNALVELVPGLMRKNMGDTAKGAVIFVIFLLILSLSWLGEFSNQLMGLAFTAAGVR